MTSPLALKLSLRLRVIDCLRMSFKMPRDLQTFNWPTCGPHVAPHKAWPARVHAHDRAIRIVVRDTLDEPSYLCRLDRKVSHPLPGLRSA